MFTVSHHIIAFIVADLKIRAYFVQIDTLMVNERHAEINIMLVFSATHAEGTIPLP